MIRIVTPAVPADDPGVASDNGNSVTARRWADMLAWLGHQVRTTRRYNRGEPACDLLVALHARKSADSVRVFRADHPDTPIVVALTGTDLYPDLATAGVEPDVLAAAARLVVLQRCALDQLAPPTRDRARVVVQSVPPIAARPPRPDCFEVAFLAHLRPVKDPLRLAQASRLLPDTSRLRVTHAGAAYEDDLAAAARAESAANPRYDWLGPVPREQALEVLARSRLLALTSRCEGGANVVSEALAAGVPVLSSRIPGSVGLLGADYPGYFQVGDTADLAARLHAAETDADFYQELRRRCGGLRSLVAVGRERQAWAELLSELGIPVLRRREVVEA